MEYFLMVMGVIAGAGLVLTLFHLDWMPPILLASGYHAQDTKTVTRYLAQAMAAGEDLGTALHPCVHMVEPATRQRILRFQSAWAANPNLSTALQSSALLPPSQQHFLQAAEAVDPRLMPKVLARYGAQMPSHEGRFNWILQTARFELILLMVFMIFFSWNILPVYERMFDEYGVEISVLAECLFALGNMLFKFGPFVVVICLMLLALLQWSPRIFAGWWYRWQPFQRRHQQRQLLLDGIALGLPEAALGRLLQSQETQFSGLTAAVGINATTPQALAAGIERAQQRWRTLIQIGLALMTVAIPVLLGVLVGVVVIGLLSPIFSLVNGLT